MEWSKEYFKKLRSCLQEQRVEANFCFAWKAEDEDQTKYVT